MAGTRFDAGDPFRRTPTTTLARPTSTQVTNTPVYGSGGVVHTTANTQQFNPAPAPAHNSTLVTQTPQSYAGIQQASTGGYGVDPGPSAMGPGNPLGNTLNEYLSSAGGGAGGIRQAAYEDQEQLRLRAGLNREEFDRRYGMLTGSSSGGPGGPGSGGSDPNASRAAHDAIFARAKDRAGQIARSSTDAVRNVLSERGVLGGGYEADAYEGIVNAAQGELGEVNRDLMIDDLDRLYEVEDRNFQDATIRRGQDLGVRNSLLGLMNTSLY